MSVILGSGNYRYEELPDWPQVPAGWDLKEIADVAVDPEDNVYVFSRGEHPVIKFSRDGKMLAHWGEGLLARPHGLTFAPDGTLWIADDTAHCIYHATPEGKIINIIGEPGKPAPRQSGKPFNQPTKVALHPQTGEIYVSDGYGNAKVHRFTPDGKYIASWGEYGTQPGCFNLVHSICADPDGRFYVADRENHRVQVFDDQGKYLTQWNNMYRACGLCIRDGVAYIGQLLSHLAVNADYPNMGACVTIHDMSGKQLVRLGGAHPGEKPGEFTCPHGVGVDSHGDIYVGEVSWTAYGKLQNPPHETRCLRKLVKV